MNDRPTLLNSATRIREVLHELRAPLGGIHAMCEMLMAQDMPPHQRDIATALAASAAHLRAIADTVLGAGEDERARAVHSLRACLETIAFAARARAEVRGLNFMLRLEDESLADLPVGTTALRQVIENLVDNALRLSSGDVTLIAARRSPTRVQFAVFDHGPGLSAEEAERLIREGGGIEGRPGGAGLGLSISGRIVAEHGGRLEGGPGDIGLEKGEQGACFTFDWPDGSDISGGTGAACLVVDDHAASRLVMRTILAAAGYRVLEAADPREALAVFERHRPALVISDLNMPNGGGQGLMFRLATLMPGVRPHLIVISADDVLPDDPLHGVIDASLCKPISVEAVLGAVAQVQRRAAA
jgi:CheY-like chemotaxis protein/anti-sigma regulatory factor (Ser/Thr protein kinase)